MFSFLAAIALQPTPAPAQARPPVDFSHVGFYGWSGAPSDVSYEKIGRPGSTGVSLPRNVPIVYPVAATLAQSIAKLDGLLERMDLTNIDYISLGEENPYNAPTYAILDGLYAHIKANYPAAPPIIQWFSPVQTAPNTAVRADAWMLDSYGQPLAIYRRVIMKHFVTGQKGFLTIWASPAGGGYGGYDVMIPSSRAHVALANEFNLPMSFFAVNWNTGGSVLGWLNSTDPTIVVWRNWVFDVKAQANATNTSLLPADSANFSSAAELQVAGDPTGQYRYSDSFASATGPRFLDDATVAGFLNLRWDFTAGSLIVEPKPALANVRDTADLVYGFRTLTTMSGTNARIRGSIRGAGSRVAVALSLDGQAWYGELDALGTAGTTNSFDVSVPEAATLSQLHVRVRATVPHTGDAFVALDDFDVTATVAPPPTKTITLQPDGQGRYSWSEDLNSQNYLSYATITNLPQLQWSGADLYTGGVQGSANTVALRWDFATAAPVTEIIGGFSAGAANARNLGGYNLVGISLDGQNLLTQRLTLGLPTDAAGWYKGPLFAPLVAPGGTSQFSVHYVMTNTSGAGSVTRSNVLDTLDLSAR